MLVNIIQYMHFFHILPIYYKTLTAANGLLILLAR
jgi:hypothetical protein